MNDQLKADAKKLLRLQKSFLTDNKAITSTTLAGRSVNILYEKSSDNELLEYKTMLDNHLTRRGTLKTIALSVGRGFISFEERWGNEICNEMNKYPIKRYIIKKYSNLTKYQKKVLKNCLVQVYGDNDYFISMKPIGFISEAEIKRICNILEEAQENRKWEHWFDDSSFNPYLIKVIKKLHKNNVRTPGVILFNILVPLGKKIEIHEDYNTGQYPMLVDI